MFLRPQHFQQFGRYIESTISASTTGMRSYNWGIQELSLDDASLTLGKISITKLTARLPDGTCINIPEDDDRPLMMDVPENTKECIVYLAIPLKQREAAEIDAAENKENLARYSPRDYEVINCIAHSGEKARISVGKLRLRLLLETDERNDFACLGIARITEIRSDKHVQLDERYTPPALDCNAASNLKDYIKELVGLLHHRGDALANRVTESGRGGTAEIADFMLLQTVNRYEPLLIHFSQTSHIHPETLYQVMLSLSGELSTFSGKRRRPAEFPGYRHEDLNGTFKPVILNLRQALGTVLEQTAVGLPIKAHQYGIHVSTLTDRSLIGKAYFVLAVRAQIPADQIASRFPAQSKIGPAEKIRELVNMGLPGITLRPLPVAPRQIPYHAGYTYFELDRGSEFWKQLAESSAFAFHIGGEFPGLEMEFWAIKE